MSQLRATVRTEVRAEAAASDDDYHRVFHDPKSSKPTQTKVFRSCDNCGTALEGYGDPAFCPECGVSLQ